MWSPSRGFEIVEVAFDAIRSVSEVFQQKFVHFIVGISNDF